MPTKQSKKTKKLQRPKHQVFKKYKDILNLSLQHYYNNDPDKYEEFTDQDFTMIMKDIHYGIRKGWELLHSGKKMIDLHCHVLCCTVSLMNFQTYESGPMDKLTDVEKLYLFFFERVKT